MKLKNEHKIFELILSIDVDKWIKRITTADSVIPNCKARPFSCELNINGVFISLIICAGAEALVISGVKYSGGEELIKLAEAIRDRISQSEYDEGDQILHNLLEARKNHII